MKRVFIISVVLVLAMGATAMAAGMHRNTIFSQMGIDREILGEQTMGEYLRENYTEQEWVAFKASMVERKQERLSQALEDGFISQEVYKQLMARLQNRWELCQGTSARTKLRISEHMSSTDFGFRRGGGMRRSTAGRR